MHDARLAGIDLRAVVHAAPVVPENDVADAPTVCPCVFGLRGMRPQAIEEGLAFRVGQAHDVIGRPHASPAEVERALFRHGVYAHQRMDGAFDLFGLRQVWLYLRGREYAKLNFSTPIFYRYVRHPLYVGWITAFWATPTMTAGHLLFSIVTTAYILVAIYFEERNLVEAHGRAYAEYRRQVPMLIPALWKRPALDPVSSAQPSVDEEPGAFGCLSFRHRNVQTASQA